MFNHLRAKQLKEEQGRETGWLAKQINRSREITNDYLSGRREPDRPIAVTMALAFEVPVHDLWTENQSPNQNNTDGNPPEAA